MMSEAGLIASRFLHYTAVMALFGASFYPFYACRPGHPSVALGRRLPAILFGASLAALLSGFLWFAFTTATMAGSLRAAADWDAMSSVLQDMAFGHVWIFRVALMLVLVGLTGLRALSAADRPITVNVLAALLLATLAGVGHTQQNDAPVVWLVHTGADGLHLLAAGAWLGGLLALAIVLASDGARAPDELDA